jgi:sporulation protein YhbH
MKMHKIEGDHGRFRSIVRGRIRKELRKFLTNGELVGRKGKGTVSIPLPHIDIPRFKFGQKQTGGVGQGEGDVGDSIGQDGDPSSGQEAGDKPGEHVMEVDVTLEELAEILGEELELPRIEPKGKNVVQTEKSRYVGIRRIGPESLRHFKRTFKAALLRQVASGEYDPMNPIITPERDDRRYRSWEVRPIPENSAVMIYMMDVSGSMGEEQKEIVRIEAFWLDTWLRSQYKNIQSVYIVHDAEAKEVDEHTFYHLRESGGTKISSAYALCSKIIRERFNPLEWNIYPFHFSDGDNWGADDTAQCFKLLDEQLLPASNVFCYGQVRSAYGSGKFKEDLDSRYRSDERVITSDIANVEGIMDSIRDFLGKGK